MKATMYTDGASKGNPGPSGIGIVIYNEHNQPIVKHGELIGHGTNNHAEYVALKKGLELAKKEGVKELVCYTDSQLLANHANKKARVQKPRLVNHMIDIKQHIDDFDSVQIEHVRRHYNREADELANMEFRKRKVENQIMNSI
jgi:ribonuclease HI